ncbi:MULTISPECIES: hypothetical protein [unclassified Streptomyces]|uniref:hypothetical protein n=1 Tax=unclassified Streptomyces TaxID=2593676 RepID=UPI00236729A8|nr:MULTISPECIES: hypothetical protein [unclassified Streptomyces]MDF3148472.1 hypothetical protein [Streptomyces sp. T21Q-yed]WDF39482.1 hypothetical protein PBV52_23090 [Streptomyces sp. T12]
MSTARGPLRSRAWLRVLVLLLFLLVPGAHTQAHAVPMTSVASGASSGASGELAEHDVLDTVLRPLARPDRRNTVRLRPAPLPKSAPPGVRACPARPAPPRPPYVPHILRTVVLRC